ncbi:MAG: chloride channel protein [Ignavibacteriaceae bacterium]
MRKKERDKFVDKSGLPVAPSMEPTLRTIHLPQDKNFYNYRSIKISLISILLGIAGGFIAQILTRLIGLITNLCFYGVFSFTFSSPAQNHLGLWVIIIPIAGAIVVGFMAKYGSAGIRGHGIPEAMEQVLLNESKIQPRLTFLKPISAAISIGTGGPFGAEGPIIATGGALGSLIGQLLKTSADERKILLAAGAAAGMAATFGSPISAVLLAVELLLFEFNPQSLIPVTLASAAATAVRIFFVGTAPIFALKDVAQPGSVALVIYLLMGLIIGVCSVFVTKAVYLVEDMFDKLPIHWMWWPAIGAIAVGIVGYFAPHTLGVGYDNIDNILNGSIFGQTLIILFVLKFVSWAISLGSGTSGGTLAPLFTIGGGLGATLGSIILSLFPNSGVDIRIAALVGMAAMFAGSARALLASMIFAFETTMQPHGLLPLLAGCSSAYLVSSLMMRNTIMTEKIARRGVNVPSEYAADFLIQILVKECATKNVVSIKAEDEVSKVRKWLASGEEGTLHHAYPVIDEYEKLIGIIRRRELENPAISGDKKIMEIVQGPLIAIYEDNTMREAADMMAKYKVTRIPIIAHDDHQKLIGLISHDDILNARRMHNEKENLYKRYISFRTIKKKKTKLNNNSI